MSRTRSLRAVLSFGLLTAESPSSRSDSVVRYLAQILVVVVGLMAAVTAAAQNIGQPIEDSAEQRKPVFRGLAWGDPPEALETLGRVEMKEGKYFSFIKRDGVDIECLQPDGPVLRCFQFNPEPLGSIRIDGIYFTFWHNELMHIEVTTYGAKIIEERFYALLEARYGMPTWGSIKQLYSPIQWDLGDTVVQLNRETSVGSTIRSFALWSPERVAAHNAWVREQNKAQAQAAW